MKYIFREIESEEEFIETFVRNPGWVLSPTKLDEKNEAFKNAPSNAKYPSGQTTRNGYRKLFFWRRECQK